VGLRLHRQVEKKSKEIFKNLVDSKKACYNLISVLMTAIAERQLAKVQCSLKINSR
jgi:hypothetical protein